VRASRFLPLLVICAASAGCGFQNESSSEERLRQARDQGAQEERIKQLEQEVKEQNGKGGGTTTGSGDGVTPAPDTTSPAQSTGNCGGGITANSSTTCQFARNVKAAYGQGGSSTVSAFSPATNKTISMTCAGDDSVVRTGGNNARVTFP